MNKEQEAAVDVIVKELFMTGVECAVERGPVMFTPGVEP